jgi:adenylosuccinate synthase
MTHKVDLVMDFQYGSTGKGLIAGYLAKREEYDTVICAFATNAGHTYIDREENLHVMTQQLPTAAVVSKTVKNILLGPGSLIHMATLMHEIEQNEARLVGKRIMIHPQAAVVEGYHAEQEREWGMAKIGSTTKGVGAAMIERIKRSPDRPNTVHERWIGTSFEQYVVTEEEYRTALLGSENVLIEGAQGFSLSLYHGQYPYTTSRDVTPWQILADCGVPYRWASHVHVIGTCRTFPIRVNNREGSSGPNYPDQKELSWDHFTEQGIAPELTTVTKLKRRIFTFSQKQIQEAVFHCGGYWDTRIFLNFANYCASGTELREIVNQIEAPGPLNYNPPRVVWIGYGDDDTDIVSVANSDNLYNRFPFPRA